MRPVAPPSAPRTALSAAVAQVTLKHPVYSLLAPFAAPDRAVVRRMSSSRGMDELYSSVMMRDLN